MLASLSIIAVSQPDNALSTIWSKRHRHQFDLLLVDAAEGQQIDEQPVHHLRRRVDVVGVAPALLIQLLRMLLHQKLGKTLHAAERRPQIAGDGSNKSFQLLIAEPEFMRAAVHHRFQFRRVQRQLQIGVTRSAPSACFRSVMSRTLHWMTC